LDLYEQIISDYTIERFFVETLGLERNEANIGLHRDDAIGRRTGITTFPIVDKSCFQLEFTLIILREVCSSMWKNEKYVVQKEEEGNIQMSTLMI